MFLPQALALGDPAAGDVQKRSKTWVEEEAQGLERQETGELPCSDKTPGKEPPTLALMTPLQGLFQGNYPSPQRQATLKSAGCALPAQSLPGTVRRVIPSSTMILDL